KIWTTSIWSLLRHFLVVASPVQNLALFAHDTCAVAPVYRLNRKVWVSVSVTPAAPVALIEVRSFEAPMLLAIASRAALFSLRKATPISPGSNMPLSTAGPRFGP